QGHLSLSLGYDRLPSVLEVIWTWTWGPWLAGLWALLALAFCFWPSRPAGPKTKAPASDRASRRSILATAALVAVALAMGFGLGELGLRLMGFSFQLYLTEIEFGWPDPVKVRVSFVPDKDLLWVKKGYYYSLEKAAQKRPQVIFMGDSCTDFGSYDKYFAELVNVRFQGRSLSFLNAGVGGWSSFQGLEQLKRDLVKLKPKVVTIYYGWNDHWASFGVEDKNIRHIALSSSVSLNNLRTVQLISKLLAKKRTKLGRNRVSIEDYQANLTQMVRICRRNDIVPVLITAPTSHQPGSEPEYLKERYLRSLSDLVPLHQKYLAVVRKVAADQGAVLCDLERRLAELPQDQLKTKYFKGDGIHPTDQGDRLIARYLFECFEKNGLFKLIFSQAERPPEG
ncbi:MAG: hypothetical protein JRJ59_12065, partial [Deltaproteobacteria bacterium]|nr:hypothetical protein [Deltaproteobacteria bacterium]